MTIKRKDAVVSPKRIRYAVVGLGHIAQVAVLPSFAHAASNSQLTALVSSDPKKLQALSTRYRVPYSYSYKQYDQCLRDGHIDAVYLALPNSLHCDFATRAAHEGIHVLCEKPMAVTVQECRQMIKAAQRGRAKLMIAYRLHLEKANIQAVEIARSGQLGKLRIFNAMFTMQVRDGDIRVRQKLGGGSLYDLGVYCINAARYLFQDNPVEVSAFSVQRTGRRFREVDEMAGALLRFPGGRLANFISSLGAADASSYELIGTEARLEVDPAFEYVGPLVHRLTRDVKTQSRRFPPGDQFAPELIYFSEGIRQNKEPEPSGLEGLIDVQIVQALYRSAAQRKPVQLTLPTKHHWPRKSQARHRPPLREPPLIHTRSPSL